MPSYYFTLYKKLRLIAASGHGNGATSGGFNADNPDAIFGSATKGPLLGATTTPADSPLWAVLDSRAMGSTYPTTVNVGAVAWKTMPLGTPATWTEFQVTPATNKIVDRLGAWITQGKQNDTPHGVIGTFAPIATADVDVTLFAASMPVDNGTRPGVPWNFWDTAQIFLTNPATGATVNPTQLTSSSIYNLVGVVGNRGSTTGGRFGTSTTKIEARALVMVFGTGVSPAVELPALSNLDDASSNSVYEIYQMPGRNYEALGFRLTTQDVFDGLVQAIDDSGMDLGGLTPDIWLHGNSAHLCAKLIVRNGTDPWPLVGDTPDTNARLAQKNLAPFSIDVEQMSTMPNIVWRSFVAGQGFRFLRSARIKRFKENVLRMRTDLPAGATRLFIAVPTRAFKQWFDKERMRGLEVLSAEKARELKPPMPDSVVLAVADPEAMTIVIPDLNREYIAFSIGIMGDPRKFKPGAKHFLSIVHSTLVPDFDAAERQDKLSERVAGGLTFAISFVDTRKQIEDALRAARG